MSVHINGALAEFATLLPIWSNLIEYATSVHTSKTLYQVDTF